MSVRHEWYQTDQKVVITILLKNANEKNCKITIEPTKVQLIADENISLEFLLYQEINAEKSTHRISSVKIEISLIKLTGIRWEHLERSSNDMKTPLPAPQLNAALSSSSTTTAGNTSTNIFKKDWDKVTKEIDKDSKNDEEGDALNNLFKKIYSDSSEETRRAMNKSFTESGGTVLSTNWKDIAKERTVVKPPDGVEFKKWNE